MQIIAVANQKGGVGKTATAHTLGVALADLGQRILLVDIDPQSSLTGACGIQDASWHSMAEVLGSVTPGPLAMRDIVQPLGERLALAPGDIALAGTELGLVSRMGRENTLKKALAQIARDFDACIIDCPPSLGLLTVNALAAAQGVLIPTIPQAQDLRGLRLFLATVAQIREALNPELQTVGVLVTFYAPRLTHHQEALALLEGSGLPLLSVKVGRSVRVAEAAATGQTILTYGPNNPQAAAYRDLGKEVLAWLQGNAQP